MKKIKKLIGITTKFRIKEIKIGLKSRYQIQSSIFGFVWSTVANPLIISPEGTPYEFKLIADAENKRTQLELASQ